MQWIILRRVVWCTFLLGLAALSWVAAHPLVAGVGGAVLAHPICKHFWPSEPRSELQQQFSIAEILHDKNRVFKGYRW